MVVRRQDERSTRTRVRGRGVATATTILALACGQHALAQEAQRPAAAGPDQLAFSTTNMDAAVSPAVDFYQYAVGGWLKRVVRPERFASYGFFEIMADGVQNQMKEVLTRAGQEAATADKGSPTQQVGTFYNAYLNVAARDAAGLAPIKPYLDEIDAMQDFDDLVRLMADLTESGGPGLFALIGPDIDFVDNKAYITYAAAGTLGLSEEFEDVFEEADGGARITAYRTFLDRYAGNRGPARRRGGAHRRSVDHDRPAASRGQADAGRGGRPARHLQSRVAGRSSVADSAA